MSKGIESMQPHELAQRMKLDQLTQLYMLKQAEISDAAQKGQDIDSKTLEECIDMLTEIQMLDPDLHPEKKDEILKIYADRLTAKGINKNRIETN